MIDYEVNRRLKFFRESSGMSQIKLAEICQTTQRAISATENLKSEPSWRLLINLHKNCPDLNYHWLITGEGDMFKKEKIKDADKDRMIEILNKYAEAGLTDPDELEMFLENTIGLALRIAKKQKKGKGMHESDSTAGTGGED